MSIRNGLLKKTSIVTLLSFIAVLSIAQSIFAYESFSYRHSFDTKYDSREFEHEHNNPDPISDSVTYSIEYSFSATASVSVEATFKAMVAEVGVTNNVSLGTSTTRSISTTWNVPAYTKQLLFAGSRWGQANGYEDYYIDGIRISSTYVTGKYTWMTYSGSTNL